MQYKPKCINSSVRKSLILPSKVIKIGKELQSQNENWIQKWSVYFRIKEKALFRVSQRKAKVKQKKSVLPHLPILPHPELASLLCTLCEIGSVLIRISEKVQWDKLFQRKRIEWKCILHIAMYFLRRLIPHYLERF